MGSEYGEINVQIFPAAMNYVPQYLWDCTMYATVEPCCMCADTAYQANGSARLWKSKMR
ncbi:Cytidine and deoxycytidylate deaminase zinc-binding region [Paraburkholderia megapolitana]|jgi:tRNA(Arg) A34 adenosine deaminase TadA|uniref:Cytidine and deoxycytidylate deaminase zinc-binding region n=1 Tax=Paraburkholderia megapolitana TaxID=420953 RepID=A0A1I3MWG9_9BURK|nr:Cytidine and deoxycytidylate deaminase zinc-binding region [Paraburkholderia megapolitana]